MAGINFVLIEGNLVASGELKRWNDGSAYCNFTIANNESYKDKNGEWQNIPSYFDCVVKGKYAESLSPYLLKGRGVSVIGSLKQNRWTGEDGQKFSKVQIKVKELKLKPMNNSENGQNNQSYSQNRQQPIQNKPPVEFDPGVEEQEFIPFDESGFSEDIPF